MEAVVSEKPFNASSSFDFQSNESNDHTTSDFIAIAFCIALSIVSLILIMAKERYLESRNAQIEMQRRVLEEEEDLKTKRACPERRKIAFSKLIKSYVSHLLRIHLRGFESQH